MPFMHAEEPAAHDEAAGLWPAGNEGFARDHAAVVKRFGRFPHRNKALGRASTPDVTSGAGMCTRESRAEPVLAAAASAHNQSSERRRPRARRPPHRTCSPARTQRAPRRSDAHATLGVSSALL
jgi:hypothetical protein